MSAAALAPTAANCPATSPRPRGRRRPARSIPPAHFGGLSITRKIGESVKIGAATLTVSRVAGDVVTMRLTAPGGVDVEISRRARSMFYLSPTISVGVTIPRSGRATLAIQASKDVRIDRSERVAVTDAEAALLAGRTYQP